MSLIQVDDVGVVQVNVGLYGRTQTPESIVFTNVRLSKNHIINKGSRL